jgi:hypothetical protein
MKPLYEVTNEFMQLSNELQLADEINTDLLERFDNAELAVTEKAIAVAMSIKNMEVVYEGMSKARINLHERMLKLQNKIEKIEEYLKKNLEVADIKHVFCAHFDIKIKNNPPKVIIDSIEDIPDEYIQIVSGHLVNKGALKEVLTNGTIIPGCHLESSTRLEIK